MVLGQKGEVGNLVGPDAMLGLARGDAPEPFRFILGRAARVARGN
jgi:hypothetical protein